MEAITTIKAYQVGEVVKMADGKFKRYEGKITLDGVEYNHFTVVTLDKDGNEIKYAPLMPLFMDLNAERMRRLAEGRKAKAKRDAMIERLREDGEALREAVEGKAKPKPKRTRKAKAVEEAHEVYYGSDAYLEDGYEASLSGEYFTDY